MRHGKRVWHPIGDARDMTLECARQRATSLLASRSRREEALPEDGRAILFEDAAEEVTGVTSGTGSQSQLLQDAAVVQGARHWGHLTP